MRSKWKISMNFHSNILSSEGKGQIYSQLRPYSHPIVISAVGNYYKLKALNVPPLLNSAFLAKVTNYSEIITAQL
jgi:hypothetical protein